MAKITSAPTTKKMYHLAKKRVICAKKLTSYYKANPEVSQRLGALPVDWFANVGQKERGVLTDQVCRCFEKFAEDTKDFEDLVFPVRTKQHLLMIQERFAPKYKELVGNLSTLLNRNDVSVDYEGAGAYKMCSRLTVGDYSYALSTFKDKGCGHQFKDYFMYCHGRGMEPQHVFVNYKRSPHGRFAKPFISKVCLPEDKDGFILSQYVTYNCKNKKPRGDFSSSRDFFSDIDWHNRYGEVSFESGGRFPYAAYIKNPQERFIWHRFTGILDGNISDLMKKRFFRPTIVQDFLLEKSMNKVDICSEKFQKNIRSELYPYYLRVDASSNPRYTNQERIFLQVLSLLKVDSSGYNFWLKKVGGMIKPGSAKRFGYNNFGELVEDNLKSINRRATKQIRAVKKVRKLKAELINKGQYERYRALLRNDVDRLFLNKDGTSILTPKYYPELLDYELGLNKADEVLREREF